MYDRMTSLATTLLLLLSFMSAGASFTVIHHGSRMNAIPNKGHLLPVTGNAKKNVKVYKTSLNSFRHYKHGKNANQCDDDDGFDQKEQEEHRHDNYQRLHKKSSNDSGIIDGQRRNIIQALAVAATMPLVGLQNRAAIAGDESLLEIDQNKAVMQVSTRNIPKRYEYVSGNPALAAENYDVYMNSNLFDLSDPEQRRINVFEKAAPSVVYIDTFAEQRDAFSTNIMEVPVGTGSGFVWDDKGHIVTNYHVVRDAKSAQVAILTRMFENEDDDGAVIAKSRQASGGGIDINNARTSMRNDSGVTNFSRKVYKAKVVGVDPGKDIAVLKIDAPVFDLYPIDVGTSTGLKVGQSAFAIGNPFGLDHSMTVGVVSGIGREVKSPIGRPITNVIQTDAAINPGNSGGPLLNSYGKLIGMNTSIYSPSGASAGIGFAIPVDSVKFIVETLIRDGKVVRPVLGISYLESKQARALGIDRGVLVLDVPTNSPAFKAGMRGTRRTESGLIEIGDIIIKVEDKKINTEADLFAALESFKPGEVVMVTVNRADLESPTSKSLILTPKTLSVQLRASTTLYVPKNIYSQ